RGACPAAEVARERAVAEPQAPGLPVADERVGHEVVADTGQAGVVQAVPLDPVAAPGPRKPGLAVVPVRAPDEHVWRRVEAPGVGRHLVPARPAAPGQPYRLGERLYHRVPGEALGRASQPVALATGYSQHYPQGDRTLTCAERMSCQQLFVCIGKTKGPGTIGSLPGLSVGERDIGLRR